MKKLLLILTVVLAMSVPALAQDIPNGSSSYPLMFMMWSSTDHVTPVTGLSPTVTISKNGGTFASPSGAVTEIANGLYKVAGNATDTNTNGVIWLHATGTGADPFTYPMGLVVAVNPYDSVHFGITALPNAAAEAAGGLYTRGSGAGQINQPANGLIDVNTLRWNGTAVATPATAGIPDVNVKNINNAAAATPGASGGILISGSNAGTTTLAALTITGVTTLTGNMILSDGLTISAPSTTNRAGIAITGNGTGAGVSITGGNGATGDGLDIAANSTNGVGVKILATGTGKGLRIDSASGEGIYVAVSTTGSAARFIGNGSGLSGIRAESINGDGIKAVGGGTGAGVWAESGGGATGDGIHVISVATAGQGLSATGNGTGHGILATSGGGATGDGFKAVSAASNGNGLNGVGTGTGADIKGSGLEQLVSKAVASSFSGTVAANSVIGYLTDISATTAYDRTTMSFEAAYANAPTVANVAAAVWTDATAGDFDDASSIGKSLYTTGVVPGASGGLFIAGTNAATTITTALTTTFTGNLTGSIGAIANNAITAASIATDADTEIENAVLNAALSSHTTAGSAGKGIADASSAGDPWATALPGAYGAGTAGKLIGDNINASIAAVKAKTDSLTFTVANQIDSNIIDWKGATAPAMTGDAFARLGAPAGASVSADVAAVKAVLPAALVGGRIDASIGAIAANAITAASIASDADTEIENAVLNAALSSHTTAGSAGKGIADASSAGDPWATAVPGSYVTGTAGYIIGNNIKPVTTVQKGQAFANFPIWMLSASGAAQTGLSTSQISCQYSIDNGAWAALADTTETEIGLGKYVVDLSSGETNGNSVSVLCTGPAGTQPYRTNIQPQH